MFKRIIGAAIATGAAITAAVVVKLILDKEDTAEEESEEVRFISIDDKAENAETAVKEEPEAKKEAAPEEKKEAAPAEKEPEYSPEINEIAALYPYLEKKFIAEQFGRNNIFNEKYPEDSLITITHKAKFENTDIVREFTKIGEDNGYASEILNEKEATITRKMFTEDGSILSDIYNVANQVACLKGVYEGYNIEL